MVETYFTMRFWVIIGLCASGGAVILWLGATVLIKQIKWQRKIRLLRKHGYERYLYNVASVGDGATYAWRKEGEGNFCEWEIDHMPYKTLKEELLCRKKYLGGKSHAKNKENGRTDRT